MNASRNLPPSWMPFDISTSTSEGQAEWEGMSGAGVVLPSPDGRLCGVIVAAEAGHQQRRLYAVRLSTALEKADGLADAVAAVTGHPTVVEHRQAAGFRAALRRGCLGSGGAPRLLGEVSELGAFGVKAADLPGEPTHLDYVPREQDDDLRRTLAELAEVGGPPRMLLVVGASAAGKTRSAAEAVRYVLPQHRLLIPRYDSLARVLALPIVNDAPVVVWLDDVERYAHGAFRDNVERLLGYGAVVVATIRRAQLDVLDAPGDLRNPTGEALSDPDFATRVDWQLQWTAEERGRIVDHAAYQPLLAAVAKGISLGAYCVAGPQLVERVQSARTDDERPWRYTLVRNALDWYRTGIGHALPFDVARRLMAEAQMDGDPDSDEWEDALTWCKTPVIGAGRQSRQSVLSTPSADSLNVHDFVLDHDERNEDRAVPDEVWTAVLETASTNDQLFDIAAAAFQQHRTDVATAATMPLAAEGIVTAMYNLGLLLAESDPVTARHWYEQAAEHGNSDAMRNLGLLLAESDPVTARHWYEQAAKHGNSDAALNLMLLPEEADPLTARHKYEQAPEAGDSNADTALRELDG